jgi:catechol 2,3-dioxygenase-like lactoylglutathione lyase family enzyme
LSDADQLTPPAPITPRGIDHLVLPVFDLARARQAYAAMGFQVSVVNTHPFGTQNAIVQLAGSYLELLAVADAAAIPKGSRERFSFAEFNQRYLSRVGEGGSFLVVTSSDVDADRAAFQRAGLRLYEPFSFTRIARQPDGAEVEVGFDLNFTTDVRIPDCAFFTMKQRRPELFWNDAFQVHENTARAVADVVFATDQPTDFSAFFETFLGAPALPYGDGVAFNTQRGSVRLVPWNSAGTDVMWSPTPRLVRYAVAVDNLDATRKALTTGRVPFSDEAGGLVVSSSEAFGVNIVFQNAD